MTEKPWYVGKAAKQSFLQECFTDNKLTKYHQALSLKGNGKCRALMYFLAGCTDKKEAFSKPSKNGDDNIDFIENMFIGMGVQINPDIKNLQKTAMYKNLYVEGFFGKQSPGKRPTHVAEFKKLFGS